MKRQPSIKRTAIQIKEKPCKSTKTKNFGCGKMTFVRQYGLCFDCYKKWLTSTAEGLSKIERSVRKVPQIKKKGEKKERAETVEKLQSVIPNYWGKLLQNEINKMARLIDYGNPCLARDTYPNKPHGGHVLSRGGHQSIRYNLHNIFLQGAQSNHFQNDDGLMKEGLERVFSTEYREFNNSLKQTPALKYSQIEYKDFTRMAQAINLRLSKSGIVRSAKDRILLRNQLNTELGIYEPKFCIFK